MGHIQHIDLVVVILLTVQIAMKHESQLQWNYSFLDAPQILKTYMLNLNGQRHVTCHSNLSNFPISKV